VEARLPGRPGLETTTNEFQYPRGVAEEVKFPFENLFAVIYGQDAPVMEVETAIAIAQTLESATGRLVPYFQLSDLPQEARASGNLILVGTAASHELIKEVESKLPAQKTGVARVTKEKGEWLVVCGKDSEAAKNAGMDFILRYWKGAKDSAARKVGLVPKKLPRGIDPAKLP